MTFRRRAVLLSVSALVGTAAFVVPAQGAKPKSRTVAVVDYAFTPARLTVRPGTKIVWKWSSANSAPHDVKLTKGPRGVRRFTSPVATAGVTYARTLTVKGTYRFVCTYHVNVMRQTIVVK